MEHVQLFAKNLEAPNTIKIVGRPFLYKDDTLLMTLESF